ncbi:MAG: ABC transporter permease [Candidatus Omnitrophota bacterium]
MPDKIVFDYSKEGLVRVELSGDWRIMAGCPLAEEAFSRISSRGGISGAELSVSPGFKWDSAFVSFLIQLEHLLKEKKIALSVTGLPEHAQKLFLIAQHPQIAHGGHKEGTKEPFFDIVGGGILRAKYAFLSVLDFLGEIVISFNRLFRGRAFFRKDDFFLIVQRCGIDALGLVSLITLLVGVILAFIGAIQLRMFGAQIYIADIVGIAMVRVMGAVMTAVLMSGRTGASFAAELGIMQSNEEIDALKTLGVSPVEFLVVPRILALAVMMPLLTLYADLMGIIGGFVISTAILGLNPVEYINHTLSAVSLTNLWLGLIHSFVFGLIISVSGCYRGLKCERSSAGVGEATTSAVVTAITYIVIATAVITFVCQIIGV